MDDAAGMGGTATVESGALVSGAIELGVGGELATVEGIQTGSVRVHTGLFKNLWVGMASVEVGLGYAHVSDLDQFDVESAFTWGMRWGNTGSHPFVSIGGGWRHQEIGSFGQSRYPVGLGVGVRSLLGPLAGFRVEYRFRRILNDPVADFSEHRFTIGLSVFLRNSPKTKSGAK
ncbi:MAG: hypothetical protein JSW58_03255 [Candidatus Latescibacterota bacterium]|nr:MAG: hypothetical protein JSW58_03255 [Candidatus Latescibacterota bacterium]